MTNDIAKIEPIAPVYRYYVEDLISGKKLAELDFRGVSYKLALNSAGDFSGSLVVKDKENATNLYNATLPGVTALYILRNGVCVWGGIIWEREYVPEDKKLAVSASEFTSYLHHRKIWKTWNHEFGATVSYGTDGWRVDFDNGSSVLAKAGSTVKMEFYEVDNFKYNGYYRVADNPAPSKDVFYMKDGAGVADIIRQTRYNSTIVGVYTKENHGFNTGDVVGIRYTQLGDTFFPDGGTVINRKITAVGGPNSNYFTYTESAGPDSDMIAGGVASRPLPQRTYERVTVGVRQDTFDYVKSLIEGTFNDFVGTDFPNVYIEPGISKGLDIVSKRAFDGYNIVKTNGKHEIAVGQAVQIQDVGVGFDGEVEVLGVEEGDSIVYAGGGTLAATPVTITEANIGGVSADNGIVTVITSGAHGMFAGQNVNIDLSVRFPEVSGTYKILDTPATTQFRYDSGTGKSFYPEFLQNPFATVTPTNRQIDGVSLYNNVATVSTKNPHGFSAGNTVNITSTQITTPVIESSLDGPGGRATFQTSKAHGYAVGTTVILTGLADTYSITNVENTTTSANYTTSVPHNLKVGDSVSISGVDKVNIVKKTISGNVATLTTDYPHNFPVSSSVNVENLYDTYSVTSYSITDNVATVTTSVPHNVAVNDEIAVGALPDYYQVITKAAVDGNVTLTTKVPHNVWEGAKIIVSGLGAPFDGEVTVVSFTDQRIMYKADPKYITAYEEAAKKGAKPPVQITVPEQRVVGEPVSVILKDGYAVGDWKVSSVGSTTISFARGGNNYTKPSGAPSFSGKLAALSALNGRYTITSRTANTLSFSKTAQNSALVDVPQPVNDDDPQATVYASSPFAGTRVVTSVTARTFSTALLIPVGYASNKPVSLGVSRDSIFNGMYVVATVPSLDRFTVAMPGVYTNSMVEQSQGSQARAVSTLMNGSYTILSILDEHTFTFTKTLDSNIEYRQLQGVGKARVTPLAIVSTFGPFPGNADIQFVFPDNEYSGVNIEPNVYRGFELKTVGDALDEYANNINGFEYRIDCEYLEDEDRFIKKFIILPIDFPNPPGEGEVSPISRFGADKLVFEYPSGSITTFSMRESAEESATRFFALGENELGPDVGPYIGVASAEELLKGERDGRRWPLLDASDSVDGIDDKNVLYAYAQRFLSELQPPFASFQITLNGSRSPFVGTYKPGDWCSIVVDDPWMQMRLSSDLEPRSDVLVRKIDSISISVPDGVTYPENVTVNLVAEWEVDKRG